MWRSLWRSIDRFSPQEFKYLINELQEVEVVNKWNKEFVVDVIRSLVEIITYGDRRDPSIFESFMENQVLAEFLRILKISRKSGIEAQLLHYLGIMIQNMDSEHAIYYCLSNEHINNIILQPYDFDVGDLSSYYISFLRTVSGKLNRDTICLLVKVQGDVVVSFPLYTEALRFAWHEEKMIQTAVRALTLSIYSVSDDMVYAFITSPPVSEYFSELVLKLREKCCKLDSLVGATKDNYTDKERMDLSLEADKVVDDLYYFKDILCVGEPHLSRLVCQKLLSLLVLPIMLPPLPSNHTNVSQLSAVTSLYILSRLLQIVDAKELVNTVAVALLYPYGVLSMNTDRCTVRRTNHAVSYLKHLKDIEDHMSEIATPESRKADNCYMNSLSEDTSESNSHSMHSGNLGIDNIQIRRDGIMALIFSGNHALLLASLVFMLILSESKDLDDSLCSTMGLAQNKITKEKIVEQVSHSQPSKAPVANIFAIHMPQILNALLEILASQPPFSVSMLWNTGWVLRKLLVCQEKKLSDHDFDIFNLSCKQSCKSLLEEINRSWFDYIPVTLNNEWESCKRALEESSQSKDPFFCLQPVFDRHIHDGYLPSSLSWKRMVYVVKVFVLHHLLKSFILKGDFLENPLLHMRGNSIRISGRNPVVDVLSTNFGTELSLGQGIPCKIAVSKSNEKDVYMVPVAKGISGKLLLAEKLPLRAHRGVVIAVAPLAGLNPMIDENHRTWLHLQVREYEPTIGANKSGRHQSVTSDHQIDRKWTLGFPDEDACEAAQSFIENEISLQRSSVESLLKPLLQSSA